jgi:hypothetical protein
MGAWGPGLYSDDFALDLRGMVKSVARLPFAPDKLLELLCAATPESAREAEDEGHTVFWLVVADQFAKRGIDCPPARDRALGIIADGSDLKMMEALDMDAKAMTKRRAILDELRVRLAAPIVIGKPRATLKAPQKLLLGVGDAVTYPVCKREPINPYAAGMDHPFVKAWRQDGWGAFVVAECGHAFEFLAWYRPFVIVEPFAAQPCLDDLLAPHRWLLRNPGTLSARHLANMELHRLGAVPFDAAKFDRLFPRRASPVRRAVVDISLANQITVHDVDPNEEYRVAHGYSPTPRISGLAEVS